jgi:hypothetical protein
MPTLHDWRHIIAHGVSTSLSVPDLDYRFECVHYACGILPPLPCAVLQQGGQGTYVEPSSTGVHSTVCMATAIFTLWLMIGDVLTEQAADVLDDLITQLYSGALKSCRDDPLKVMSLRSARSMTPQSWSSGARRSGPRACP